MTKTIWKHLLKVADFQYVKLPKGSKILTAQNQYEYIYIWAIVNPKESERVDVPIWVYRTGDPIADFNIDKKHYINTVLLSSGKLCFHVFTNLECV